MMKLWGVALLIIVSLFCATNKKDIREMYEEGPTLLITNNGVLPITVTLKPSMGGGKFPLVNFLSSGESKCVSLPRFTNTHNLVVSNMNGKWESMPFAPMDRSAWKWVIGKDPEFDVLSLDPDDSRCKPQ